MPASRPLSANADAITVFALTPRSAAMRKSSAAARICMPMRVRWRKSAERRRAAASVTPTVTTSSFGIDDEPIGNDSRRPEVETVVRFGSAPEVEHREVLEQVADRERRDQQRRRARRRAPAGTRRAPSRARTTIDDRDVARISSGQRRMPDEHDRVGADHDQLAVGEVDQAHDPEDQRDPEREERVEAAERDRVDGVLDRRAVDDTSAHRRSDARGRRPRSRAVGAARRACPESAIRPVRRT